MWTYIEAGLAQYQAWANSDPDWHLRFGPSDPAALLSQKTHIHRLEPQLARMPALALELEHERATHANTKQLLVDQTAQVVRQCEEAQAHLQVMEELTQACRAILQPSTSGGEGLVGRPASVAAGAGPHPLLAQRRASQP